MSRFKQAIILGIITAVATPLFAQTKTTLTTTVIPGDVQFLPPSHFLGDEEGSRSQIKLQGVNPSVRLTLADTTFTVRVDTPAEPPTKSAPEKIFIKSPTKEFTLDTATNPILELPLGNSRKYFVVGQAFTFTATSNNNKKIGFTVGSLKPAGIQTGKIGQTPIAIFDANFDGQYTLNDDAIILGPTPNSGSFLVQPLSKYLSTPQGIIEIQSLARDGSEITTRPYTGPTASLATDTPGQDLKGVLILTSDASFNIMLNSKTTDGPATVIPGNYKILTGFLNTRGRSMILTGDGMQPLKLTAGTKQTLALSGPKNLEFRADLVNNKVTIKPDSLLLRGDAGEAYKASFDSRRPPEVFINVDGETTRLGKMEFG
ncbi:MAG: hypothetical protein FWD53_01555 [Phycisphaerales bacterium]|nr:hypothetical protein [Phycisphaerales bacterium]